MNAAGMWIGAGGVLSWCTGDNKSGSRDCAPREGVDGSLIKVPPGDVSKTLNSFADTNTSSLASFLVLASDKYLPLIICSQPSCLRPDFCKEHVVGVHFFYSIFSFSLAN